MTIGRDANSPADLHCFVGLCMAAAVPFRKLNTFSTLCRCPFIHLGALSADCGCSHWKAMLQANEYSYRGVTTFSLMQAELVGLVSVHR